MNTFKKALAITVAALTLGGSAAISTQASAHEWFRGHDFHFSFSRYDDRYDHDRGDYRRDRDRDDRYEYRGHERHDYFRW